MPDPLESFGDHYERVMREEFGSQRMHVMTSRVRPWQIVVDQYVMYLPLEITEGANMTPRMARVTGIETTGGTWKIFTELGLMQVHTDDLIQVVT